MNLKDYQVKVRKLAKAKGYKQELFYLHSRLVQESCELLDAIWLNKSKKEKGEEGADLLHFFFEMMDHVPEVDIDKAMDDKIDSNYVHKKKTDVDGKMVRK